MGAVVWIVIAVALAVAEMFTGTFVLIMLAGGAGAAAIAAALGAGPAVQAVVFAIASALALVAVRPVIRKHMLPSSPEEAIGLNALEGSSALVLEQVGADHGLVKIDGEMWTARAYDTTQTFEPGERVRVVEIKGATALVWRE